MSCLRSPPLHRTAWVCGKCALQSETGKWRSCVAASVATPNLQRSVHPDAPETPRPPSRPQSKIPRVNSLLTMAKRRWAGHVRVDEVCVLHSAVVAHSAVFLPFYLPAEIDRSTRSFETGGARLK